MAENTGSPYLDTWKDAEPEVFIQRKNASTGKLEPATGLTGLTLRYSATSQGGAIGTLSVSAAERASSPGYYFASIDFATLASQLSVGSYPDGTRIYLQLHKTGDIDVESWEKIVRRTPPG